MNQTDTNTFFHLLHDAEDARAAALGMEADELICQDPDYMEGYDYVMDIVKDAVLANYEVNNLADLDNFVNQVDAYAGDFSGEYGRGYQEAANLCLGVVNALLKGPEVALTYGDLLAQLQQLTPEQLEQTVTAQGEGGGEYHGAREFVIRF
jgi:hypothetical protein